MPEPRGSSPTRASPMASSRDRAAQKVEPLGRLVVNRLRDTLEFITDAGKALDAADKAGSLLLKTIPTAAALYQIAQALF